MNTAKFKKLKVGDIVTLSELQPVYRCGFPTGNGRAYLNAGAKGTVAVVDVPAVRGRERSFACVDFSPASQLLDARGRIVEFENRHRNEFRCGCFAEEIE